MQVISREELIRRLGSEDDLRVVDVLPPEQYQEAHLPRAINVPLDESFEQHVRQALPDRSAPVVVYCRNEECPASTKAAMRLDALGYLHVYDYSAGKEDWRDAGLPVE